MADKRWILFETLPLEEKEKTFLAMLEKIETQTGKEVIVASALDALNACQLFIEYDREIESCGNNPEKMASHCTAQGDILDSLYFRVLSSARIAIACAREKAF